MKHIFLLIGLFFTLLQGVEAKTYRTIASGSWDDASTWEGGDVPSQNMATSDVIIIGLGHVVTSSTVRLMWKVRLEIYGTLKVNGSFQTSWQVNVIIHSGAYLEVQSWLTSGGTATFTNNGKVRAGNFGIFTRDRVGGNVGLLPIELKSFVASASQGIARFVWVTASEKNNDYFTIEQSSDLKNWETIHRQQGAGNSFSELSYKAEKKLKGIGIFYFRLKQTDYDGQFSYSKIVSLSNNTLNEELPSAFSENGEIVIRNTYEHLQVFNIQGRLLGTYSQTYRLNDLPKGILVFVFDKQHKQKIVNY